MPLVDCSVVGMPQDHSLMQHTRIGIINVGIKEAGDWWFTKNLMDFVQSLSMHMFLHLNIFSFSIKLLRGVVISASLGANFWT